MTYENKAYIPQSPEQLKREYLDTPFWFSRFGPGSQITIVEDLPRTKPLRYIMKPSQKGGPAFATNLIKISDGFVQKDLEISKSNAQLLFINLPGPEVVQNLKGCTFANDNGRWVFVSQSDGTCNGPKSAEIAKSMEPSPEAPTDIGNQIKALHAAMQTNQATGVTNSFRVVIDIAEKTRPGDALRLVAEAKKQGWITERVVDGVQTYRAE